jgi:hypothetical protein
LLVTFEPNVNSHTVIDIAEDIIELLEKYKWPRLLDFG